MDINWTKIFERLRQIIDVLTTRFFEVFDYLIDHKIIVKDEEESTTGA